MSEPEYEFNRYDAPEPNDLPIRVVRNGRFRCLFHRHVRCLQFLKPVSEAAAGETRRAVAEHYGLDPDSILIKTRKPRK